MSNEMVLYEVKRDQDNIELVPKEKYTISSDEYSEENTISLLNQIYNLGYLDKEYVYIISINQDNSINGLMLGATGNKNHADIDTEPIILFLVFNKAKGFSIFHNHPNNLIYPSEDDYCSVGTMKDIARSLNIVFYGSYILGKDCYCEVNENIKKYYEFKR